MLTFNYVVFRLNFLFLHHVIICCILNKSCNMYVKCRVIIFLHWFQYKWQFYSERILSYAGIGNLWRSQIDEATVSLNFRDPSILNDMKTIKAKKNASNKQKGSLCLRRSSSIGELNVWNSAKLERQWKWTSNLK